MNQQSSNPVPATISFADAAAKVWDVLVIGAGPAGALIARQFGRGGLDVLLVDKRAFPRDKVCGGCLNPRAMRLLESVGLGSLVADHGGVPLQRFCLATGSRHLEVPVDGSWALARRIFDAALVRAAIECGSHFLPEVSAAVCTDRGREKMSLGLSRRAGQSNDTPNGNYRSVYLEKSGSEPIIASAHVVVAADGLGSPSTASAQVFMTRLAPRSRIGVATTMECRGSEFAQGAIYMAAARFGYVGLVRLANGWLHVAAALDRDFVRRQVTAGQAVRTVLAELGWEPVIEDRQHAWHGTLPLTRSVARPASWRTLLIGDAAGYVEPFTGEGIAWALEGAIAAVPLVAQGVQQWSPSIEAEWTRQHRLRIRSRQKWCRGLTGLLRYPALTRLAMISCACLPGLTTSLARRILDPVGR